MIYLQCFNVRFHIEKGIHLEPEHGVFKNEQFIQKALSKYRRHAEDNWMAIQSQRSYSYGL